MNSTTLRWTGLGRLYAQAWSWGRGEKQLIAVSTFDESQTNTVYILSIENNDIILKHQISICLPITDLQFVPILGRQHLLATGSDFLRIWSIGKDRFSLEETFTPSSNPSKCGPITSIIWPQHNPDSILAASSDTTISIWNLSTKKPTVRLIAHDSSVSSISCSSKPAVFATCSVDSSVRVFDQRDLTNSIILYESPTKDPLIDLDWNQIQDQFIITVEDNGSAVVVDLRLPEEEYARLDSNGIENVRYSPLDGCQILTAGPCEWSYIWSQTGEHGWSEKPSFYCSFDNMPYTARWNPTNSSRISVVTQDSLEVLSVE